MALPVSFRWDDEFVATIDAARGSVPRSAFVRAAVEAMLSAANGHAIIERHQPHPEPSAPGTVARGRQPSVAHATPARPVAVAASARPSASPRSHLPRCACAICKPPKARAS